MHVVLKMNSIKVWTPVIRCLRNEKSVSITPSRHIFGAEVNFGFVDYVVLVRIAVLTFHVDHITLDSEGDDLANGASPYWAKFCVECDNDPAVTSTDAGDDNPTALPNINKKRLPIGEAEVVAWLQPPEPGLDVALLQLEVD